MTAAERERPEDPAPAPEAGNGMSDSSDALSPSYPLHEPLVLSREALLSLHERSRSAALRWESQSRMLRTWACGCAAAALALVAVELSVSTLAAPSSRLSGAIQIAEGIAAAVAIVLLAWGLVSRVSGNAVLERHRAERCLLLKFRFLIDPSLWTRRGNEARERREAFQAAAGEVENLTPARMRTWAGEDTVAIARTLPVGSGIDPHTVHTLVDYYQERRLNPRLEELARAIGRSSARDGLVRIVPALFFTAVVAAAVHVGLKFSPPRPSRDIWSEAMAAVAVALPALGLALRLSRPNAFDRDRARLSGLSHTLSALSSRLQKASGAEAIFQELGFCEDALETHHREWVRATAD
jgi:hypothetical protein